MAKEAMATRTNKAKQSWEKNWISLNVLAQNALRCGLDDTCKQTSIGALKSNECPNNFLSPFSIITLDRVSVRVTQESTTWRPRSRSRKWRDTVFVSPVRIDISGSLSILENRITVLNDKLYRKVLGVHVCHFTLKTCIAHNGRCKHDSQVLGRHLEEYVSEIDNQQWVPHTKFSGSRWATRARWNMRNSRQSRCRWGIEANVLRRWSLRSSSSTMAVNC